MLELQVDAPRDCVRLRRMLPGQSMAILPLISVSFYVPLFSKVVMFAPHRYPGIKKDTGRAITCLLILVTYLKEWVCFS